MESGHAGCIGNVQNLKFCSPFPCPWGSGVTSSGCAGVSCCALSCARWCSLLPSRSGRHPANPNHHTLPEPAMAYTIYRNPMIRSSSISFSFPDRSCFNHSVSWLPAVSMPVCGANAAFRARSFSGSSCFQRHPAASFHRGCHSPSSEGVQSPCHTGRKAVSSHGRTGMLH